MPSNELQPNPTVGELRESSTFAAFAKKQITRQMQLERLYGPAVSALIHVLVIILLLLVVIDTGENPQEEITVTMVQPEEMQLIEEFTPPEPQSIPEDVQIPDVASPQDAIASPAAALEYAESDSPSTSLDDVMDFAVPFDSDAASPLVFKGLFAGRGAQGRAAGLAKYAEGKGNLTEGAVLRALEWLKNHQQPDGSWHNVRDRNNVAFTGLAALTFLAHGETLNSERYGETLRDGLRWLIEFQQPNGAFSKDSYAHAIAAYAVSEGYALTQIPFLRESMENAAAIIINGQQDNGGWTYGYAHDKRRDTSVMGWQIQALKAAQCAGCAHPELNECLRKAAAAFKLQYFDSRTGAASGKLQMGITTLGATQDAVGTFTYAVTGNARTTGGGNASMTAVGTLCLEFLGEGASMEARGGRGYLRKIGCDWLKPGGWPLYRWYYTTQAIFQGQGIPGNTTGKADWQAWNNMFAKAFVNNQNPDGSWSSPAKSEDGSWLLDQTGSVYSTALGALTLMVYYRILPSYQQQLYAP